MTKLYFLSLLLIPCLVDAAPIQEGTYIGVNGKKLNISAYHHNGTYQYQLIMQRPETGDIRHIVASESVKIEDNQQVIFTVPDNAFDEENPASQCQTNISFLNSKILVSAASNCDLQEQGYNGQYAFSQQSSFIPQKYWGKWDDCTEPAYIKKGTFSADGYHNYGVLGVVEKGNGLELYGYTIDEGEASDEHMDFKFHKNGKVDITIIYDGIKPVIKKNLKACS